MKMTRRPPIDVRVRGRAFEGESAAALNDLLDKFFVALRRKMIASGQMYFADPVDGLLFVAIPKRRPRRKAKR